MIIGICSNKGGSGKSTTAVHFAFWLAYAKKASVILVDVDVQASSSEFIEVLNAEYETNIPYSAFNDVEVMTEKVAKYSDEYDYVVIDSPGNNGDITRAVIWISQVAIIPVHHTGYDEKGALSTFKIVKNSHDYRQGMPIALSFVSQVIPNTNEDKKTLERLKGLEDCKQIKFMSSVISNRAVIGRTSREFATVWQMKGEAAKQAQLQYSKLFQEMWKIIK